MNQTSNTTDLMDEIIKLQAQVETLTSERDQWQEALVQYNHLLTASFRPGDPKVIEVTPKIRQVMAALPKKGEPFLKEFCLVLLQRALAPLWEETK